MISFPPKEESLGKTYRAFWRGNKFLNKISIPLAWKRWVRMLGVQPRVSCRSSQHRAGTKYSFPLVSTGDWFQDPYGYPNLQMFKAPNWPSVSTGSASADSNTTENGWLNLWMQKLRIFRSRRPTVCTQILPVTFII